MRYRRAPATEGASIPPRRPQLSQEYVDAHRRARLHAAAAELAHEHGVAPITSRLLCELAGMARVTFYKLFDNVADCLTGALEAAAAEIFAPVHDSLAAAEEPGPAEPLAALYARIAAEPLRAELLLIHSPAIGQGAGARILEAEVTALTSLLGAARPPTAATTHPELGACAALALAAARLRQGRAAALPAEVPAILALLEGPRAAPAPAGVR